MTLEHNGQRRTVRDSRMAELDALIATLPPDPYDKPPVLKPRDARRLQMYRDGMTTAAIAVVEGRRIRAIQYALNRAGIALKGGHELAIRCHKCERPADKRKNGNSDSTGTLCIDHRRLRDKHYQRKSRRRRKA